MGKLAHILIPALGRFNLDHEKLKIQRLEDLT